MAKSVKYLQAKHEGVRSTPRDQTKRPDAEHDPKGKAAEVGA